MSRAISRKVIPAPPEPGFIGEGHTAVEVVAPEQLDASDPFVLLMDDRLQIGKQRQMGGAHPHAGLETVTFVLDGYLDDRDVGRLDAGDVEWLTAGGGAVHNEHVESGGYSRVLQLWVALPAAQRHRAPRVQVIRKAAAPVIRTPGAEARLYSGRANGIDAATENVVPITMLDVSIEAGASFTADLSTSANGFFYVLDGELEVEGTRFDTGEVGWFGPAKARELVLHAADRNVRVVLYAGEPIREPLVHHGPFVAGSPAETRQFYQRFRSGAFPLVSEIVRGAATASSSAARSRA